jgi:hypothetical protein
VAGDWIPMRLDLAEDPAVIAAAAATGLDEFAVVGRLHRLWAWANKHTADGNARAVTPEWVDRYTCAPGLAKSLIESAWLVVAKEGLVFPNFDRWNSQSAKTRVLGTKRVQRHRNGPAVTKPLPEKRREEKSKEKPPNPPLPRNELFDAVAEVSGLDPKTAGSLIGKVSATLKDAGYSPSEVRDFGKRFWELCPWARDDNRTRPTPPEISKNIGLLRSGPAQVQISNSKPTLEELNARMAAKYGAKAVAHE